VIYVIVCVVTIILAWMNIYPKVMAYITNGILVVYALFLIIVIPIIGSKVIKKLKRMNKTKRTSIYMIGVWIGMLLLGISFTLNVYVVPQSEYIDILFKSIWRLLELVEYSFAMYIFQEKSPLLLVKDPTILCHNLVTTSKSTEA